MSGSGADEEAGEMSALVRELTAVLGERGMLTESERILAAWPARVVTQTGAPANSEHADRAPYGGALLAVTFRRVVLYAGPSQLVIVDLENLAAAHCVAPSRLELSFTGLTGRTQRIDLLIGMPVAVAQQLNSMRVASYYQPRSRGNRPKRRSPA